jgi:hypothetical protein
MNGQLRCESRVSVVPSLFCTEQATKLVSRIDASRDYRYACDRHAEQIVRSSASEASDLESGSRVLSVEAILSMWPPKHRSATRLDAKAILRRLGKEEAR